MGNWKPTNGSKVHWHLPGGEILSETTTFTDTGMTPINTVAGFAARYANGKVPERNGVRAHLWGQADENGILSAAMERAGKDKSNPWKLSEDDFNNPVTVQDFGATQIGPEGLNNSQIMKLYPASGVVGAWPNRPGDSTDPNHRTERRIIGPYGNYEKVGMDGKTYYYFNPRKEQAGDPWVIEREREKERKQQREQENQQQQPSKPSESGSIPQGGTGKLSDIGEVHKLAKEIQKLATDPRIPPNAGGIPAKNMRKIAPLIEKLVTELTEI